MFVFKYIGGSRHFGLLLVAMVIALWMAEGEPKSAARVPFPLRRALNVGLVVLLLPSIIIAARAWRSDFQSAFSEAGDMARFIITNRLEWALIAGHPAMHAAAVLAFLPPRSFWFPSLAEAGSHMKWDAQFTTAHRMSLDEALSRLKVQKPEWADPENPVLLLVAMPLVDPAAEGYQLLNRTPGRPWFVPSEDPPRAELPLPARSAPSWSRSRPASTPRSRPGGSPGTRRSASADSRGARATWKRGPLTHSRPRSSPRS